MIEKESKSNRERESAAGEKEWSQNKELRGEVQETAELLGLMEKGITLQGTAPDSVRC